MKEVYLTQEGLEELKQRLDYLIVYLREDVAKKLQHARELGDLSENAEYDAAKQEESQVASEIKELEERIKNAVIIEKSGNHKVSIGNSAAGAFDTMLVAVGKRFHIRRGLETDFGSAAGTSCIHSSSP